MQSNVNSQMQINAFSSKAETEVEQTDQPKCSMKRSVNSSYQDSGVESNLEMPSSEANTVIKTEELDMGEDSVANNTKPIFSNLSAIHTLFATCVQILCKLSTP